MKVVLKVMSLALKKDLRLNIWAGGNILLFIKLEKLFQIFVLIFVQLIFIQMLEVYYKSNFWDEFKIS